MQVTYFKDKSKMGQILTLADGKGGRLEEDGQGISSKKILRKGVRIQNYTFKLYNKTNGEEDNLNQSTVCYIRNTDTKLYISTQVFNIHDEDSDQEEEDVPEKTADEVAQEEYDQQKALAENVYKRHANESEDEFEPQIT